jgi:peptidoglycan/xylan/chitin deacetylase (PgdA/CDA1 family)
MKSNTHENNIPIPILMYHEVRDKNSMDRFSKKTQYSNIVTKDDFDQQISFLKENGFNAMSLDQLISHISGNGRTATISPKSVLITFDDGYAGNYEFAFPILNQYKFVATFFVVVNKMNEKDMLTWEQAKEMARHGMSIQSHTMSHPLLSQLDEKRTKEELHKSKLTIEDHTRAAVKFISLPNGDHNRYFKSAAIELGYLGGCSSRFGFNDVKTDPYFLKRISIKNNCDLNLFKNILTFDTITIEIMRYQYLMKQLIARIMSKRIYHKLYNKFYGVEEY